MLLRWVSPAQCSPARPSSTRYPRCRCRWPAQPRARGQATTSWRSACPQCRWPACRTRPSRYRWDPGWGMRSWAAITIVSLNNAIIINMLRSRVPACVLDSGRKKASINFTRLCCKIFSLRISFLQHFAFNLNQTQLNFGFDFKGCYQPFNHFKQSYK